MSYLPRISSLEVSDYEMYPGGPDARGLHHEFAPGVSLVVGANGLGKTTLITLLRHMCAGPHRLSNRGGTGFAAGGLTTTQVELETFADRVGDRAGAASARLVMELAGTSFDITRSLRNLALTSFVVDQVEQDLSEDVFQRCVVAAAQVPDYAHWILLIDYLMFVTEDRAEPFWNRNIQRYLLRVLTRDVAAAAALSDAESRHVSADSDFRNARVQLNRHRQRFQEQVSRITGTGDINERLLELSRSKERLDVGIAELEEQFEPAQHRRAEALREEEAASAELQRVLDEFDVARLTHIEHAMPTQDDVLRYLSARLATNQACPWCGKEGGDVADQVPSGSCFFCGLPDPPVGSKPHADLIQLESKVRQAEAEVKANATRERVRNENLQHLETALAKQRYERADLERRIKALRSQLPQGDTDLGSTASFIADLEADLEQLRVKLEQSRRRLQELMALSNDAVRERQDDIKLVFDRVATMFLVERCELVPHEAPVTIGQEGPQFEVQAFDLELGSSTEVGTSRRDTRDAVSESQRIFVDVAFRIALIDACVESGAGTLVVDAPEGSLDAVFSSNAATLLHAFVASKTNRLLVVASNLVDGSMLPKLAELAGVAGETDPRLINLLNVAAPTAAVLERGDEYRAVLSRAMSPKPPGATR